ncbi:uncharacterized protein KRP23_12502 [Phytophthora ramorum]|uniref:Uncharacterized protein n=1 Tax=Phytophthora ramorum TaxID=164328 RepID=H3H6G9_PHYRM|nr:hypothetical protein KRP23_12502 [Phytophthora ramorum]
MTITPNFDKWAKRGIALRNFWSSWRTSRSMERLLFGQLPYDSVTKSGMTGGQRSATLSSEGTLNDTVVTISRDHGQGPDVGNDVPETQDVSATCVAGAIIAEGRLRDAAGLVIDDATEQYDMLNTLLDIVGVPLGGFDQDGLGRSLKLKVEFGERVGYSNNPTR